MQQTVAILGGGVAGLSAAHELAERGFKVHVYERKTALGGKARSLSVPNSGTSGRLPLPGEHGFLSISPKYGCGEVMSSFEAPAMTPIPEDQG